MEGESRNSFENNKLMNEGLRNGQNTNEPKKCLIVLILCAQRLEMNSSKIQFSCHEEKSKKIVGVTY